MKKKMIYPILGMLLLLGFNAKAQFETINLNNYKLTDFKYRSLSTGLNASNSNSYSDYKSTIGNLTSKDNTNQNSLNGGGDLSYSSRTYNRKYAGTQSVGFGFNSYFRKSSTDNSFLSPYYNQDDSYKTSSNSSNFSLGIYSNNRFYLSNDFFMEANLRTSQSPSNSYSKADNNLEEHKIVSKYFNSKNTASFKFGNGRIENVTDARVAVYILDDLLKQGRLSRTPKDEEVFAFADFITKTLNKRVIDSRIKRIKEYVAIDSFLVSSGLSTKTVGLYFGLINDNCNYARLQSWETGSEWHVGISPFINYTNKFEKATDVGYVTKSRNELSEYGLSFDAGYNSSWISGLKWQQGYSVNASFGIYKYDTVGTYFQVNEYKVISGDAGYHISYIPSTRTSLTGQSGVSVYKYLYDDINNKLQVSPYLLGTCNYYFSEKLRFQANANVSYSFNKEYDLTRTTKTWTFGVNVALQYSFF